MKTYLPNDIKNQNRQAILDLILQKGHVSKAELTQLTRLSFVTTSKIVDFFLQNNILVASGQVEESKNGQGRKRVVYEFNPNSYFTIGVELIANAMTAVLVNLSGEVVKISETIKNVDFQADDFVEKFLMLVQSLKAMTESVNGTVIGLGLAVDGAIDVRQQQIRMRVNALGEEQDIGYESIKSEIETASGLALFFENDVNASAVAEFESRERDQNLTSLFHVYLGTGIGSGIIIDKNLYRGNRSKAGEIEYLCFDPDYQPSLSNIGWLEEMIGRQTLEKRFDLSFEKDVRNDAARLQLCEDYVKKYLVMALVASVSFYDIRTISLAGRIFRSFSASFLPEVEARVNDFIAGDIQLQLSKLTKAAAIGVAILSMKHQAEEIVN